MEIPHTTSLSNNFTKNAGNSNMNPNTEATKIVTVVQLKRMK